MQNVNTNDLRILLNSHRSDGTIERNFLKEFKLREYNFIQIIIFRY